jgi:hypothetical protein
VQASKKAAAAYLQSFRDCHQLSAPQVTSPFDTPKPLFNESHENPHGINKDDEAEQADGRRASTTSGSQKNMAHRLLYGRDLCGTVVGWAAVSDER